MLVLVESEAFCNEYEIVSPEDVFSYESAYLGLYSLFIRPVHGLIHVVPGFYTYGQIEGIKRKILLAFKEKKNRVSL